MIKRIFTIAKSIQNKEEGAHDERAAQKLLNRKKHNASTKSKDSKKVTISLEPDKIDGVFREPAPGRIAKKGNNMSKMRSKGSL